MIQTDSLHPQILFHFTNKDSLYKILESTFRVSYAKEKIVGPNLHREFGVPMVSFCDLRLSEIKSHMSKYGNYGIGLNKSWANRQGLNPVMYLNRHCQFTDDFISAIDGIYRRLNSTIDEDVERFSNDYMNLLNTYRYFKNYEGELSRSSKELISNYRYADEREWRYVPPISLSGMFPFVPISRIDTKSKKKEFNDQISDIKLSFEPDDIKYLIIERDDEIKDLIEHLRMVKDRFNESVIDKLLCRILTSEQINNDI